MPKLNDTFKPWWTRYAIKPGPQHCFVPAQDAFLAGAKTEREACADCVPTNWLDPLLTGPNAVANNRMDYQEIVESLLRAVKQRIREREEKQDG